MTAQQSSWQDGERAADALGPEAGLVARIDPAGFAGSVGSVLTRAARRPDAVAAATLRFGTSVARIGPAALSRWAGGIPSRRFLLTRRTAGSPTRPGRPTRRSSPCASGISPRAGTGRICWRPAR